MRPWTYTKIFYTGDDYFESLLGDIENAKQSITLESYIFDWDSLTQKVLNSLKEARARGVEVKIVVDGFGSSSAIPQLRSYCRRYGIDFRVFQPMPTIFGWLITYFWRLSKYFKRFNRRNHRKVTIIDEKRAYLGSLNFTADHVGPRGWRDTGVCVEGDGVRNLSVAFHVTYLRTIHRGLIGLLTRLQWQPRLDTTTSLVRLNTTQRNRRKLYVDLLKRIRGAKTRIYVTTAYFLPKRSLVRALMKASKKGVDVRILIPGRSDVPVVKWAAFNLLHLLRRRKVKLYEYEKSILHAKTMVIDDIGFIGSQNLNHRSLIHDLEVEVVLKDKTSVDSLLAQWEIDLKSSHELSESQYKATSRILRVFYKLAFRLRYML